MAIQIDNAGTSIPEEAAETRTAPQLELRSGPWSGYELSVPADGLILGRQGQLAEQVALDPTVSRQHARVYFSDHGQPVIEDLGSVNGTFVNGHPISGATALNDQDVIKIGNIELRFATAGARKEPPDHEQNREPPGYAEALARFKAGDVTTALALLQACYRHDPGHFGTLYGLGMCYSKLEDRSRARHWLAAAQAIEPRHPGVARAIKALDQAPHQPAKQHHLATGSPRAPQAEPSGQGAVPGPRRPLTLAQDLDGDEPIDAARLPGELIWRGHRRLLSHKRLYIGVFALIAAVAMKAHPVIPASYGGPTPPGVALRGPQFAFLGLATVGLIGAMLNQALTHYEVYERRIDISQGVLFRKRQMIWLYEIVDIQLVQSPLLMFAGTGTLIFQTSPEPKLSLTRRKKPSPPQLQAFGSISRLREMQQELLATIEVERRAMKKNWI
jgi:membrane protein YdbS with pleckstrin-like domain